MVRATFPEPHGAREETTRHTVTPELAAMLLAARRRRGWSQREAARNVEVACGTIGHLEHGRRAPSTVVAENLIEAYQLDPGEAAMLRAEAVEDAGRSYPFKRGGRSFYGSRV
jgi:transcriptional regulator with XRE-family HTH domain